MARGWGIVYREAALCQPDLFSMQPGRALAEPALRCGLLSPGCSVGTAGGVARHGGWVCGLCSESLEHCGVAADALLGLAVP